LYATNSMKTRYNLYLLRKTRMTWQRLVLILLFYQQGVSANAQIISVKDAFSKTPLEFVTIVVESTNQAVLTNSAGQANIELLQGAEDLLIRSLGYKNLRMSYRDLERTSFVVELTPSSLKLDEVVISANRWYQSAYEVPSKVESIKPQDVAFQNPQTAADLLGISNKVFIQKSQQGGGSPMIRGFATNRLVYTVDGVRMNTAIFRSGNIQNVINIDPFSMQSTEVLFGPGSVIYGSDAIGGVMSFQTLDPQFSLNDKPLISGKFSGRYSTANQEKTGHFNISLGFKKWAIASSFSRWEFDHLQQGSNGPNDYLKDIYVKRINGEDQLFRQSNERIQRPSAYSQFNTLQKVKFKPNANWEFKYGFHYSETSEYGRFDRNNRFSNGLPRYAEWNYGPQKWMMNNLEVNHKRSKGVYNQVSLRLAQQSFVESRISRELNEPKRENRVEGVEAYSLNLDFKKATSNRNKVFYGVEYVINVVNSNGYIENIDLDAKFDGPDRYPQATWESIAAYFNNEYDWKENVTLQAGVRYNQFVLNADFRNNLSFYPLPFEQTKINQGALSGSLGGVYRPAESWVVKLNLGTAFRAPNVDDLGKVFDSEPGAVVVPNNNLKAEYAYNIDLSFAKIIKEKVKLDFTAYYTLLDQAMVRRDFQLNGLDSILYDGDLSQVQALQNAAEAFVYGLQFGVELKLPKGITFRTDINYQDGEEELDDGSLSPSRQIAPFFGGSQLEYKNEKLRVILGYNFQGEFKAEELAVSERNKTEIYALDAKGNSFAPAWHTINLKAEYMLYKQSTVMLGLENITDQRYRPYSSGISGSGRNFIVAFNYRF